MPDVARLIILRSTLCFLILILCADVYAQKTRVDELLTQLDKNDADTNQIKVMRKLSAAYSAVDPVKKFYYANQYLILAEKHNIDSTIANAYLDMGISYGIRSNVDSALYYFKLGYERAKASNYSLGIARSHANIGYAYDRSDRKKEAIQHYENALKIFKKYNIKKSINQNITNLGSLYYDLGEYKIADGYFRQVLASVRETPADEIGLGNALFSLGNSNLKLGNQTKALGYFKESLAVREKIGDLNGIALSNWGIGRVLIEKEQYQQSLIPLNIALKNNRILKNLYHESAVLMSISRAHLALKKYEKAEEEADLALQRANESSSRGLVSQALELLVDINKEQKDFAEALRFQSNYIAVKDSLNSHEMKKDVLVKDINRVNSDNKDLQLDNETIA
ncbi:MAG: tetratricopeptide repeat protein [Pedobacter sp.]|nr:MAG: tetratricopeptide repeat protein [Pedobacter sp.]